MSIHCEKESCSNESDMCCKFCVWSIHNVNIQESKLEDNYMENYLD